MVMHLSRKSKDESETPKFLLVGSFALSMYKFRRDLLEAIIRKGFEVHVSLPIENSDEWIKEDFESMGICVHDSRLVRTGTNPIQDIASLYTYWRLIRRIRPTHMLSYTIKPIIYASLAASLAGVPNRFALVTGRGYAFEGGGRKSLIGIIAQFLYRVALGCVSTAFFQNEDDMMLFRESGLIRADRRTVIVNGSGVRLDEYSVVPLPEDVSFLLIARLLVAKGIREFVAAATLVKKEKPKVTFRVVGWIDDNPDSISEAELEEWKKEGVVEFLGRLDDVRPAISSSSVYVLPSYREGTPRTVLEAMAMGRPVITTDTPGCREPVIHLENGFLVTVGSVLELAQAISQFVERPSLIRKMGNRSREIIERRYDVHDVNSAMLAEMRIG